MLCISNSWFLTSKPSSIYRGEILAAHSWNTASLASIQILICAPNLLLERNHEYLHYQIDLALFRLIFIKFQHLHKSRHTEGEKNHKKGGLCFWKLLLSRSEELFSGSESELVQSLSEFRVYVQWINVRNRRRNNTSSYTGSFHKPEVVLSSLNFQGEFH